MDNLLFHLLEINLIILICSVIYFLFREQLSHANKRWVLLSIPGMTALIFLLKFLGFSGNSDLTIPVYQLDTYTVKLNSETTSTSFSWDFSLIYWVGFIAFASVLLFRILRLTVLLISGEKETRQGLKILHLQNQDCFSFLGFVQLKSSLQQKEQDLILEHERIHVEKKHSYDILFMQLMHCINWFNPIMVLLKKELINVHEYQVDEIMYNRHKTEYMEFLLSYSLGTSSTPYLLTNQFYSKNTLIKRMKRMKQKTKRKWFLALIIPFTATTLSLVSWTYADRHKPTPILSVEDERIVGDDIEKMPEFKGGQEALINYLSTNITYPETAKTNKIEGTVYISFVVDKTGKIGNCSVKRGVHEALDNEALRVISSMPDWIPGESGGKKVNVEMTLPINFKL